uniref:Uncharacterized protein n=1 Tax=Bionectria ochroleuca TaxID=29856 RepID=A0A8H7NP37_BIOOC
MADSIRGDGFFRLMDALAALVENPERLDRERERFNKSPPAYRSNFSHNSTLSQSPELRSEKQILHEERKWQLIRERWASSARSQFDDEWSEERKRIDEASLNRPCTIPIGKSFSELAQETVKARWVEQGIWNEKWKDEDRIGKWKHEEPSELESESEAESEPSCSPFCPLPREQKRNRDGQSVPRSCNGLRSDDSYESVSAKRHAHFISSSIKCQKNVNESKPS